MDIPISRRKFLLTSAAAASAALVRGNSLPPGLPPPQRRKVLHLIGHAHIDAPWLWPWRDSANAVLTTWESAVDRMGETPGFRFSASAAQYYRWAREADPRLFAEIVRRVKEGRWEATGGWIVEPDCNLPSTESFIRQALLGKRYLRDALGADVTVGFNPDSFGHAWGLPTILSATGYKYYAFTRPGDDYPPAAYPKLFWWEGPDGARILAWRIQLGYGASPELARSRPNSFFAPGFDHGALVYGVGNHGGGPTKAHLAVIQKMAADPTMPVEVRFSTWREFFAAVEREPAMKDLPVVRSDLEHVFRGCYSANGEAKWLNRRAERRLMTAETMSSVAAMTLGWEYPVAAYDKAWWEVCFNQFHDALAGSAMRSTYVDGRDGYGVSGALATETTVATVEALSRRVDMSRVKEGSLFCFNPLPWPRTATVEMELSTGGPTAGLKAQDGTVIPLQLMESAPAPHDFLTQLFYPRYAARIDLPACGYRVFELSRVNGAAPPQPPSRVALGPNGGITGFATSEGVPLLVSAVGFVVVEDKSNAWGMKAPSAFDHELGRPTWISSMLASHGPLRRIWTQKAIWRNSTITVEMTETFDDDILGITVAADWHEPEEILMLEIPTVFASDTHFAKVAGATIIRRNTGDEEPGQDWVALEGDIGGAKHTLALVNAQTYSYNCKGGRLRTVIVRSAPWSRDYENGPNQDIGFSVRRFGLMGSKGSTLSLGLERRALEFQTPIEYVVDSVHPGTEPWERSFLEVSPGNVSVTAIKHSEAGSALIVRLQETAGTGTQATIRSRGANWSHTIAVAPWSIVTVAITTPGSSKAKLNRIDPLERSNGIS